MSLGKKPKSNVKQLRLLTVKNVSVEKKPKAKSKRKTLLIDVQLSLFYEFDRDAK
jgi:hypothetical protein